MSTWTKQKLGSLIQAHDDKSIRLSSVIRNEMIGSYPYYGASGIIDYLNEYKIDGEYLLVAEDGENLKSRKTPIAFWAKGEFWVNNHAHIILGRENRADTNFLKYWFSQADISGYITGSAQPKLLQANLNKIEVLIPDFFTQKKIVSILLTYDDLIENNEKRIKILEEMAERLYREWFVKFQFPGHEKVRLIDSGTEYGKIPEGWEIVPMIALADFVNGYPFKPRDLGEHGLPIIKIPELRSGILDKTPRNNGESIPKKYFVKSGDIVFSWSATLLVNIWNSGDGLLNQHLFKVTPKQTIYRSYVFYALIHLVEKLSKYVVGATMQHLRRDTVVEAKMLLPRQEVLVKYEDQASRLLGQISILYKQNQNLSKTRDLLIPQLITGKWELKN